MPIITLIYPMWIWTCARYHYRPTFNFLMHNIVIATEPMTYFYSLIIRPGTCMSIGSLPSCFDNRMYSMEFTHRYENFFVWHTQPRACSFAHLGTFLQRVVFEKWVVHPSVPSYYKRFKTRNGEILPCVGCYQLPFWSGSDRRERTVPSVLNGQSVLFYHYRSGNTS